MDKQNILARINKVFVNVFDNEDIQVSDDTTASEIEEWDSLNHIQLIVAIEKEFKIRFTSSEIHGFKNVGDMCEAIIKKQAAS